MHTELGEWECVKDRGTYPVLGEGSRKAVFGIFFTHPEPLEKHRYSYNC